MKVLNGSELAGYIKERQAREVRSLRQAHKTVPKLAIVLTIDHPVIGVYVRMKKKYGADIRCEVDIHHVSQPEVPALLERLNAEDATHGIILQLPLADPADTERLVNLVAPEKDVDALGIRAIFEPATPMAILWLLAGYNVELTGRRVVLVGRGKLVGAPLERMLTASGIDVAVADSKVKDLKAMTLEADVIISATGRPGIVQPDMVKEGAVVVDAGVAGEQGKTVGDLSDAVYERQDLVVTPRKGGVGPLTVCALFENVIRAARGSFGVPDN